MKQFLQKTVVLTAIVLISANVAGADVKENAHLSRPYPGGMPGRPIITGITAGPNGVTLSWDGPAGNYEILEKRAIGDPHWKTIGAPGRLKAAAVSAPASSALFQLSGPAAQYAGAQACIECHRTTSERAVHTEHFGAFTNASFINLGGQTDSSCLPCHSVGYGSPKGFLNGVQTPQLANVQCESCHGPSALHAANPEDPVTRPRVDISSSVCGGCHNREYVPTRVAAEHPPTFEDWNNSAHRSVNDELKTRFSSRLGAAYYIPNCGSCHSGTVREALLEGSAVPPGEEAGAIGVACATCHDPHQQNVHTNVLNGIQINALTGFAITNNVLGAIYTNQIGYPLASLIDHHAKGTFGDDVNPEINLCAQCHNDRGATAEGVERPPHKSAQYNMLIGTFRAEDTAVPSRRPGSHALLEKQCVSCHMQSHDGAIAKSGHTFKVQSYDLCKSCHESPESLVQFTTNAILYQIQVDKRALDFWAQTRAPAELQKYGSRAWEYANPGALSGAGPSPTVSEQMLIPESIRKARFNLYLVYNEGSFGVHNGPYTVDLLFAAYDLVVEELLNLGF